MKSPEIDTFKQPDLEIACYERINLSRSVDEVQSTKAGHHGTITIILPSNHSSWTSFCQHELSSDKALLSS